MARAFRDQRVFSEPSVTCPIPTEPKNIHKYSKDSILIREMIGLVIMAPG